MAAYCEDEDVYLAGLPRGSLGQRARDVASLDASSNRLEVSGNALALNTPIQFQVDDGGSFPPELNASTVYYAKPVADSDSLIEVSATVDGAAIDFTGAGELLRLFVPIGPTLAHLREVYSRWLDGKLVGHQVPVTAPYHPVLTHIVAVRTGATAARMVGLGAQGDRLYELETELLKDVAALIAGVPLRGDSTLSPANLARGSSPTASRSTETIP